MVPTVRHYRAAEVTAGRGPGRVCWVQGTEGAKAGGLENGSVQGGSGCGGEGGKCQIGEKAGTTLGAMERSV